MRTARHKLLFVGILFLFLWSFFLRFYHFGQIPNGLYWDETAILLDAKVVAQTGMDMHSRPWYQIIYPSYGDYKLPVYIWFTAATVKVLGATETAARLPSAIAGIFTIIVSGFLVRELLSEEKNESFKNITAVSTSLTVALSPWSILFSRTGFEAHLAQALLAFSLLLALLSRKRTRLIFISPIFGILATYTYFSARYVWLVAFILLSPLFLVKIGTVNRFSRKNFFSLVIMLILPIAIFSIGLIPMFRSPLYEASNTFRLSTDSVLQNTGDVIQSNIYREVAGNQKIDRIIFYKWWLTGKKLLANYSDNISLDFLFVNGDPNLRHGTGEFGLFFIIELPFFIAGWYVLARRYKKIALLLLVWWLSALLPASVPNTTPHALRSLNALVPLAIVIGIGISYTAEYVLWRVKSSTFKIAAVSLFFLLISISLFQFSHFYLFQYPRLSNAAWQGGYKQLAENVFKVRDKDEPVFIVNFDDRFYLWLLLYGPYSAKQIQQFPHSNFQIRDFDNIYTEHFPALPNKVVIVGTSENVQNFAKNNSYMVMSANSFSVSDTVVYEAANLEMNTK